MTLYTIDEILAAFSSAMGAYPRAHVNAALSIRAEITPRLIEVLNAVREEPERCASDEADTGHLFAVMLLGYWGETAAHGVIVALFRLPERWVDLLFGDFITEDLPMVLYRTSGGSLAQIKALALDPEAYKYCRSAALRALSFALVEGAIDRAEVLDVYRSILRPDVAPKDPDFAELALSDAADLRPVELMEIIRQGFDEGWLGDGFLIDFRGIKDSLREDEKNGHAASAAVAEKGHAKELPRHDARMGHVRQILCTRPARPAASSGPTQIHPRQTKPPATTPAGARGEKGDESAIKSETVMLSQKSL